MFEMELTDDDEDDGDPLAAVRLWALAYSLAFTLGCVLGWLQWP